MLHQLLALSLYTCGYCIRAARCNAVAYSPKRLCFAVIKVTYEMISSIWVQIHLINFVVSVANQKHVKGYGVHQVQVHYMQKKVQVYYKHGNSPE
jgi:hypothetical protein